MRRVSSNSPAGDFVAKPFQQHLKQATCIHLAAPYFTRAGEILEAARSGKSVQLLIGLNSATSPEAVASVVQMPNLAVRYLTHRFHAKIYLFDDVAMVGSSNLTDAGLMSNREAVVCFDRADDFDTVEEVRALFAELWEAGRVLTTEVARKFRQVHAGLPRDRPDPDTLVEKALGRAGPRNVHVASHTHSRERIFVEELRRLVYQGYRPAFTEVASALDHGGFRRPELHALGAANETNRFLNWVRLTHAPGDEAWRHAPLRSQSERRDLISRLGTEWVAAGDNKVPSTYADWLGNVGDIFGSPESIAAASAERLTEGLMSLHAFTEQLRFTKGGLANLPAAFWAANNNDVVKLRRALTHLLHGQEEFIQRLHDLLYDPLLKPAYFGRFSALELVGTVLPDLCPPMNGRMAKALRFLGFNVQGN